MTEITPESYVSQVWFCGWCDGDVLITLTKKNPAATAWDLSGRFRKYRPDPYNDPFTDDDLKNNFNAQVEDSEEVAIENINRIVADIGRRQGGEIWAVPVRGGPDALFAALKDQPWAHIRPAGSASN